METEELANQNLSQEIRVDFGADASINKTDWFIDDGAVMILSCRYH